MPSSPDRTTSRSAASPLIIPAKSDARVAGVFAWYVRRLLSKKFHAVRLAKESGAVPRGVAGHDGPVIVLLNHSSWWDPLIAFHLSRWMNAHAGLKEAGAVRADTAPMDAAMLRKFGFFRRLGMFGIEPDAPGSEAALLETVMRFFETQHRPTLWITPQGQFADVRTPVRIRPGAAALAAAWGRKNASPLRVISLAIEYGFWLDQKPEVFLRVQEVVPVGKSESAMPTNSSSPGERGSTSTTGWMRAMTGGMRENASALAGLVIAREPGGFECVSGGEGGRVNPVYDAFLRVTGRSGEIEARRR